MNLNRTDLRRGMAYAGVLVLMTVASALALAFLLRVSISASSILERGDTIRARYLAEAAVHHATWRLLNQEDFPASEDIYEMHSLDGGRYGYKVRRHTPTTFATISGVGHYNGKTVRISHVLHVKSASGRTYRFYGINPIGADNLTREATAIDIFVMSKSPNSDLPHPYSEDSDHGTNAVIQVSRRHDGAITHGLPAFREIIGDGPNQIPLESDVVKATLKLWYVNDNKNANTTFYRMTTRWSESSTWNSMGGGVNPGTNADNASAVVGNFGETDPVTVELDVTDVVKSWVNGEAENYGWGIINSSTNGMQFASTENTEGNGRHHTPILEVLLSKPGGEDGLVAHYTLDQIDGTDLEELSGYGHIGALGDGPTRENSPRGGTVKFDGINDYTELDSSDTLIPADASYTLSAWFSIPAATAFSKANLLTVYGEPSGYTAPLASIGVAYGADKGTVWSSYRGSFSTYGYSDADCLDGGWHHLAMTYDAETGNSTLYYDGLARTTVQDNTVLSGSSHSATVGTCDAGFYGNVMCFPGWIDDVRIYNKALDAGGVANLSDYSGPRAHWKFDESSGKTASDSSGYENHGTLINMDGTEWVSNGSIDGAPKIDGALKFDGNNDYADAGQVHVTGGITISSWIRPEAISQKWLTIVTKELSSGANYGFSRGGHLGSSGAAEVRFYFSSAAGWHIWETTDMFLQEGTWQHVAVTYDETMTPAFYLNGEVKTAERYMDWESGSASSYPPLPINTASTRIGRDASGHYWQGQLDDTRIYDRVLDPDAIGIISEPGEQEETTVFWADMDISVLKANPDANYGASTALVCTKDAKSLIHFDLSSLADETRTIQSVTLSLYATADLSSSDVEIYEIRKANAGWTEGVWDGNAASDGDPCWNYLRYDSKGWFGSKGLDKHGKDYHPNAIASISGNITAGQRYEWSIPADIVQGWIDAPGDNAGIFLWTNSSGQYYFASTNAMENDQQPKLEIFY